VERSGGSGRELSYVVTQACRPDRSANQTAWKPIGVRIRIPKRFSRSEGQHACTLREPAQRAREARRAARHRRARVSISPL